MGGGGKACAHTGQSQIDRHYRIAAMPQVGMRLAEIGWAVLGEWRERVRGWLPTPEDDRLRCEFMNLAPDPSIWQRQATERGLPYFEERYTVLAAAE